MGELGGDGAHEHTRYGERTRTVTPLLPAETGTIDGLAYTLWLPARAEPPAPGAGERRPDGGAPPPGAGVVIIHGAGSCKESHHDFARAAVALGLAAVAFDQRGHGASDGPYDGRAIDDVAAMAGLLRHRLGDERAPIALRGSSLGGYLALAAAQAAGASAVVAICPASAGMLRAGLEHGRLDFPADVEAVSELLRAHPLEPAVRELRVPLLLLHAEGDERVPVEHSRDLAREATAPGSRLITLPGGHHRSIQHDQELQAVSLRFIQRALDGRLTS